MTEFDCLNQVSQVQNFENAFKEIDHLIWTNEDSFLYEDSHYCCSNYNSNKDRILL